MRTKIKLTAGKKVFMPGDIIDVKMNKKEEAFLLREGYIEETKEGQTSGTKAAKKASSQTEEVAQ